MCSLSPTHTKGKGSLRRSLLLLLSSILPAKHPAGRASYLQGRRKMQNHVHGQEAVLILQIHAMHKDWYAPRTCPEAWGYFASKGFLTRSLFPESLMRSPDSLRTYLVAPDSTQLYVAPGPGYLSRREYLPR